MARRARSAHQLPADEDREVRAAESFELRIAFDKSERRVELIATVSEAVADAVENAKALQTEGLGVDVRDIAGVGFEPTTSGL
jgi:GAF domain-containing protein